MEHSMRDDVTSDGANSHIRSLMNDQIPKHNGVLAFLHPKKQSKIDLRGYICIRKESGGQQAHNTSYAQHSCSRPMCKWILKRLLSCIDWGLFNACNKCSSHSRRSCIWSPNQLKSYLAKSSIQKILWWFVLAYYECKISCPNLRHLDD